MSNQYLDDTYILNTVENQTSLDSYFLAKASNMKSNIPRHIFDQALLFPGMGAAQVMKFKDTFCLKIVLILPSCRGQSFFAHATREG